MSRALGGIGFHSLKKYVRGEEKALSESFLWFFLLSPVVIRGVCSGHPSFGSELL
ncbi:hypothetical protein JWG45_12085 [Leptospira sp. 201903070]|uniref:Uncharacterized protein n=1 Tax=Leptospira ainlahdjerensis TaxID=2810033 RepID=A0ABS2UBY9_9LEPT|nr:hypothetical protein [Leptospira ainlahdjerensis]MBM9577886.1 hypothetical protein [Leptospira ainlahdjerensis]